MAVFINPLGMFYIDVLKFVLCWESLLFKMMYFNDFDKEYYFDKRGSKAILDFYENMHSQEYF